MLLVIAMTTPKTIQGAYSRRVCIAERYRFPRPGEGGAYDTGTARSCVLRRPTALREPVLRASSPESATAAHPPRRRDRARRWRHRVPDGFLLRARLPHRRQGRARPDPADP